jgi:hypothetical protein
MGRGEQPTEPAKVGIAQQCAAPGRALTQAMRVGAEQAAEVRARLRSLERADAAVPDSGVRAKAMRHGSIEVTGRDPVRAVSYRLARRAAARPAVVPGGIALRSGRARRRAVRPSRPCPMMSMYGYSTRRCALS